MRESRAVRKRRQSRCLLMAFTSAPTSRKDGRYRLLGPDRNHRERGDRIRPRAGLAVRRGNDLYGDGINIATRIEDLAVAGE